MNLSKRRKMTAEAARDCGEAGYMRLARFLSGFVFSEMVGDMYEIIPKWLKSQKGLIEQ